jgi:hypothetical protein
MRRNECPSCGSRFDYWKAANKGSFRLVAKKSDFPCEVCGELLYWSVGGWRVVSDGAFLVWAAVILSLWLFEVKPNRQFNIIATSCLSLLAIRLIVWMAVVRLELVEVEEEQKAE